MSYNNDFGVKPSKNTFLRLTNPMGTFAICILDGHLVNQDGHHKIFLFTYYCVKTSYKSPLRAGNPDNNHQNCIVLKVSEQCRIAASQGI